MVRVPRLALATVLVATLLALVPATPAAGAPSQVWRRDLPGGPVFESSPLLVDVDASGTLDVVVGAHDRRVHVLRGTDGAPVAGWPQQTTHRINSSPAAADVDGDGHLELFVGVGTDGNATPAEEGGALYAFGAAGQVRFRRTLPDRVFTRGAAVHASPAIGHLDGDGRLDVAVGSLGLESAWSVNRDGATRSGYPHYWDDTVFASPAIADVNGDGVADVIYGGDSSPGAPVDHRGGLVRALSGNDGRLLWEVRTGDIVRSSPSVGDVDGDGHLDVVFGGGEFWGHADATVVWAVDAATGAARWKRALDGVVNASPTLADVDGDGRLDVAVGTFNSRFGQGGGGSVYALDGRTGGNLGGFPKSSGGGAVLGQIVTADMNGDGGQDLLVPTGAFVSVLSGKGGATLFRLAEGDGVSFQGSPAVADVDGDGRLDVVAAGIRPSNGSGVVFRWSMDAGARLGARGWHHFRKDTRRTGSWTSTVPPADSVAFRRISGDDRFATAVELSSGAATGGDVFVTTGTAYADALAGGPAAAALDAPVLLVTRDAVPAATRGRLQELQPDRIVVVGGPASVSDGTYAQLATHADSIERYWGDDRFETAARVSSNVFSPLVPVAYVATGFSYADALAGAAAGAREGGPVLLVQRDRLPAATSTELRRLLPQRIVILGGEQAVSAAVEAELRTYSASVTRASGVDRYDTSVRVSRASFPSGAPVAYVATGTNFADALAGGPVAAADDAPLLLVPGRCVTSTVRGELDRLGVQRLVLLGGTRAVSSAVAALQPC